MKLILIHFPARANMLGQAMLTQLNMNGLQTSIVIP
jgi:hypothetical protein